MKIFIIYLVIINLVTAVLFIYDKIAAQKSMRRIPEYTLHFLEFLGGVFISVILMHLIHHKNRKFGFYFVTYLIFVLWIIVFLMIKFEFYRLMHL